MPIFEKTLTSSESKNKIVTSGYIIETVREGGDQASINIPSDFFTYLLEQNVLVLSEDLSNQLSSERYRLTAYELADDYTFNLSSKMLNTLEIKQDNFGFFVIEGENSKPQIRPKLYKNVNESRVENYLWLPRLIDISVCQSTLSFECDVARRNIEIHYEPNIEDRVKEAILSVDDIVKENNEIEKDICNLYPLQSLYFGAPGTGKSYNISNVIAKHSGEYVNDFNYIDELPNVFRTTMYEDFTYHDFVGSVMPVIQDEKVSYGFVPGVFTQALKYAFKNKDQHIYLILEEMSRANMASVFGDIFQLLDRDHRGKSMYSINNDLIAMELAKVDPLMFNFESEVSKKIYIPNNFSIIGTVNSTDQNVFVMDTALKRRFDFIYVPTIPVKKGNIYLNDFVFKLHGKEISWINFYNEVNKYILEKSQLSEDKQIGQFFIQGIVSKKTEDIYENTLRVKNKILNYLWFDVNQSIFNENKIFKEGYKSFAKVYGDFDKEEKDIFNIEFGE